MELHNKIHFGAKRVFLLLLIEMVSCSAPPSIKKFESSKTLLLNSNVVIPCETEGNPLPKIEWLFNNTPILEDEGHYAVEEGKLRIEKVTRDDEGELKCVATTRHGKDEEIINIYVATPTNVSQVQEKIIYRNAGDTINMPCAANIDPLLEKTTTRTWFKDGKEVMASGRKEGLVIAPDNATLDIPYLLGDHSGTYVCMIKTKMDTATVKKTLEVVGMEPRISNLPSQLEQIYGGQIDLTCAAEGIPPPYISFMFGSDMFEGSVLEKTRNSTTSRLTIGDITIEDAGQYTCMAANIYGFDQGQTLVIIKSEVPQILNKFKRITLHEGDTLNITCLARGIPKPRLEWLLKDRPVAKQYLSSVETANEEFAEAKISIKNVTKLHEGVYQCEAKNNVGIVVKNSDVSVISSTKVVITIDSSLLRLSRRRLRPRKSMLLNSRSNVSKEITSNAGQKLKLPCRYANDPMNRITNLIWMKNGKILEHGIDFGLDRGYDGSITFPNVQKQHEGTYKCIVTTVMDQASDQIKLNIISRTRVVITNNTQWKFEGPKEITSAAGQKLKLPCKYFNDPKNHITNLIWTKNGMTLEERADLRFDRGYDGSITIPNVQKQYEGVYKCTVTTVMDEASEEVQLNVA